MNIAFELTRYGMKWGGVELTRLCSHYKLGWVVLEVKTKKDSFQVYVTKTGKMRLYGKNGEIKIKD